MKPSLDRYRKTLALAERPTLARRLTAAAVAGAGAFLAIWLIFWAAFGADEPDLIFPSVGLAVAVAVGAGTTRLGLAIAYGVIGAIWLFAEGVAAVIATVAAAIG